MTSPRRRRWVTVVGVVAACVLVFDVTLAVVWPQISGKSPNELLLVDSKLDPLPSATSASPSAAAPSLSPSASASTSPSGTPPRALPRTPAKPVVCPATPAVSSTPTQAGLALVKRVPVFDAPAGKVTRWLDNPTRDHQRLAVLVRGMSGSWLRVQFAERPNGTTGWVRSSDFEATTSLHRILVEKCRHRMTVYKQGSIVAQYPVAVGKGSTPTPVFDSFVDFVYNTHNPGGSYGPYMLSVAAFSEVLMRFGNGGIGQLALHGTNARSSVGRNSSNGCIRMYNEHVTELAHTVPTGTPVTVVP